MPRWFNLANFFTLLRLVLVPYVVLAILDAQHGKALVLFFAAALTDVIDGALARSYALESQVGAYLDPIADKCLLSGIFLALGSIGAVPWWFVALVFGRDIYILLAVVGILALTKVRKFPPSRWGKLSTFFQISAAVVWMVRNAWPGPAGNVPSALPSFWICSSQRGESGERPSMASIAATAIRTCSFSLACSWK